MIRYSTIGASPWVQILASATPYLYANINAPRPFVRALATRPGATSLKIASAVILPMAVSTIYNLSDPERAKQYAKTSDYEKDNFFYFHAADDDGKKKSDIAIPVPNIKQLFGYEDDGKFWSEVPGVKLPLTPYVTGVARITRRAIEQAYEGGGPEAVQAIADHLFGEDRDSLGLSPMNVKEVAKDFISGVSPLPLDPSEAAATVVPHFPKFAAEQAMGQYGTDLRTGRFLVPPHVQGRGKAQQFDFRTPQLAVDIGEKLGTSPERVEHAGRYLFGAAFGNIANLAYQVGGAPEDERGGESYLGTLKRRFRTLTPQPPRFTDAEEEDRLKTIQSSQMRRRELDVFSKAARGFGKVEPYKVKNKAGAVVYTESPEDYEERLKERGKMLGAAAASVLEDKTLLWKYQDENGEIREVVWDELPRENRYKFLEHQSRMIDKELAKIAEAKAVKRLKELRGEK